MRVPRSGRASHWVGALVVLAALAGTDCSKVESCRPGTLFLNVSVGAYTSADELDVAVGVAGTADGGGTQVTKLTLKPNSSSGGVEVTFPAGYPMGQAVTVTLTLLSKGAALAQRTGMITALPTGCAALTIDFATTDGGTDGSAGGASGSGGVGGRGGGAGGSAGHAGTGGGTGGSGTGGTGTGGGAGGKAGAGAAGASGGTGGACVPTGPENCFNNIDDDCDGKIDCADPDCQPKAQCVVADPTSAPIGTLTGAGAGTVCPTGYDKTTTIMSEPNPLSCTGCTCNAPAAVTCSTTLTSYNTTGLCEVGSSVVEKAGTFTTGQDNNCNVIPSWSTNPSGDIFGIATTKFTATVSGGCTPGGSPIPPTLTFAGHGTFCATSTIGGGCAAGQVCVPSLGAGSGSACQLFDGAKSSCPGGAAPIPWYTGSSGSTGCSACSCGTPAGASCDNVSLTVGSDYGCSGFGTIASGGSQCFTSGIYEPGVQFSGTPTPPVCGAQSAYTGSLAPSGPKTLCCP